MTEIASWLIYSLQVKLKRYFRLHSRLKFFNLSSEKTLRSAQIQHYILTNFLYLSQFKYLMKFEQSLVLSYKGEKLLFRNQPLAHAQI